MQILRKRGVREMTNSIKKNVITKKYTLDKETQKQLRKLDDSIKTLSIFKAGVDIQMQALIKSSAMKLGIKADEKTQVNLDVDTETGVMTVKYIPKIIKVKPKIILPK